MKTIDNYINERLNPRHLGTEKFPIDGTLDDMIKFLENNGFEELEDSYAEYSNSCVLLNDMKGKYFSRQIFRGEIVGLEFADTSEEEISINNPLYYIDRPTNPHKHSFNKFTGGNSIDSLTYLTSSEFEKEMKEYFK
jgi:hypothetical protein